MYPGRIISKVPGDLPAEAKKEKQGYIGDLSQKTIPQLKDLLNRQLSLLANKGFINKLTDNGEKIQKLKEAFEEELKKRDESERLAEMMAALTVNGKQDLDTLEWTGRSVQSRVTEDDNDVSDNEQNPLKILATHSGAGFHKKKHKVVKPEKPLIKPSDLEDVKTDKIEVEEYARQLCDRLDSVNTSTAGKPKFLPHKTLKSEKKVEGKVGGGEKWEVTAATPPPPVHGDTKLVSLQESIRLQADQQQKLREVQMKHAAERLTSSVGCNVGVIPDTLGGYRDPGSGSSSDSEDSEHEVHDEEYPDGGGVVIYNLVDDIENS